MNIYHTGIRVILLCSLLGIMPLEGADELTYITGAPVGDFVGGEPEYLEGLSSSVDWFSGLIQGNYYLAALSPFVDEGGTGLVKTIAVYQFVPGAPPELGLLTFIDSAPTGQSPAGTGTEDGQSDDQFADPKTVSWFPGTIAGNYYFTVVGRDGGNDAEVRLYQFTPATPTTDGIITFIDSAPIPPFEPFIFAAYSVDWLSDFIDGEAYFAVTTGAPGDVDIRIYRFDPSSQTLSWAGAAAIAGCDGVLNNNHSQIDWAPKLLNGKSFFAVGDNEKLRIYHFCPDFSCEEICFTYSPQSCAVKFVTTSSTLPPANLNQPWGVRWLVVGDSGNAGQQVYIVAGCESGKAKLFQFIQDTDDPTNGVLNYVTEVPTGGVSCDGKQDDALFDTVRSVDWLVKDGAYYLVIGGLVSGESNMGLIRVYRFDPRRQRFTFLVEAPTPNEPLPFNDVFSVDWFPGKILGECYFAAGVERDITPVGTLGSDETGIVRVYNFDPICPQSLLSWRYQHSAFCCQ